MLHLRNEMHIRNMGKIKQRKSSPEVKAEFEQYINSSSKHHTHATYHVITDKYTTIKDINSALEFATTYQTFFILADRHQIQ